MNPFITQWLNKHPDSTREEMRSIRRDWINHLLQKGVKYTPMLTRMVRYQERKNYNQELKVYA
jgi:hypothetical protein